MMPGERLDGHDAWRKAETATKTTVQRGWDSHDAYRETETATMPKERLTQPRCLQRGWNSHDGYREDETSTMAGHDGCREDETARMATERLRQPRQLQRGWNSQSTSVWLGYINVKCTYFSCDTVIPYKKESRSDYMFFTQSESYFYVDDLGILL